ncbi:hypothetical protein LSH36_782g05093 [Paralvinella palmiformis]|uniref:EB domain-containing protein n=1 Tax=Paralvinella palmiformis TaxID=53620 RepID=A0AAD9J007_9ANNE|nr:hypothetical protein LSH36_782g05093 [Paralvinella palmiformis]
MGDVCVRVDDKCVDINAHCLYDQHGITVCQCNGPFDVIAGSCVLRGTVGTSCLSGGSCITQYSVCRDSICICTQGYQQDQHQCGMYWIITQQKGEISECVWYCDPFDRNCLSVCVFSYLSLR